MPFPQLSGPPQPRAGDTENCRHSRGPSEAAPATASASTTCILVPHVGLGEGQGPPCAGEQDTPHLLAVQTLTLHLDGRPRSRSGVPTRRQLRWGQAALCPLSVLCLPGDSHPASGPSGEHEGTLHRCCPRVAGSLLGSCSPQWSCARRLACLRPRFVNCVMGAKIIFFPASQGSWGIGRHDACDINT